MFLWPSQAYSALVSWLGRGCTRCGSLDSPGPTLQLPIIGFPSHDRARCGCNDSADGRCSVELLQDVRVLGDIGQDDGVAIGIGYSIERIVLVVAVLDVGQLGMDVGGG